MVLEFGSKDKHSRIKVRIREAERRFLRLFNCKSGRDIEYDFAYRNVFGNGLRVLNIGGCESLLPLMLAKRGFKVTVYDFRGYAEQHQNLDSIKGDFLENKIEDSSFDYVILISTIEHVGFGSYKASHCEDGDMKAMSEVRRVLSPNGRAVLTFPFTQRHTIIEGFERWFDVERIEQLFGGMYILREEHWVPEVKMLGRWIKWKPGTLQEAQTSFERRNYQSVACYVVSLNPPDQHEAFFRTYDFDKRGI